MNRYKTLYQHYKSLYLYMAALYAVAFIEILNSTHGWIRVLWIVAGISVATVNSLRYLECAAIEKEIKGSVEP